MQEINYYDHAFYFFFQAEDGIRDIGVTGVQTCALPICGSRGRPRLPLGGRALPRLPQAAANRSEERRVGKECRSRGLPHDQKNKTTICPNITYEEHGKFGLQDNRTRRTAVPEPSQSAMR